MKLNFIKENAQFMGFRPNNFFVILIILQEIRENRNYDSKILVEYHKERKKHIFLIRVNKFSLFRAIKRLVTFIKRFTNVKVTQIHS